MYVNTDGHVDAKKVAIEGKGKTLGQALLKIMNAAERWVDDNIPTA
ncbi:MAG: hypothetical protein KDD77_00260 [Caldilineaceae bacterium]|nr:hypothetical protein [Caldilineaceae bacterium]